MRRMLRHTIAVTASLLICLLLVDTKILADPPATRPAASTDDTDLENQFGQETAGLGGQRTFKDGVLTITLPRADLWVQNDMGDIPTGAGIESRFYFFRCPCGKD